MLMPFPQELPIEAIGLIVDRIRGKPIPVQTALNAAWNLAGYAATQIPIHSKEAMDLPVQEYPVSDDEIVTLLEMVSGEYKPAIEGEPVKFGIIPWVIVLRITMKLLSTFA
jgi:hypothetical protein